MEYVKVWLPLLVVVVGGAIAWTSALAVRRSDRLAEARAALAGALEECLSATQYLYEDLAIWSASGWGRPETNNDPRAAGLSNNISELKRFMFASRGRLRAAFIRLSVLDTAANLEGFPALIEEVVRPDLRPDTTKLVEAHRVRVRELVARWGTDKPAGQVTTGT